MKPDRFQALLQEVATAHQHGRFDEAERVCRQLRLAGPKSFEAFYVSGLTALQQHRVARAVEWLTRAHELDRGSIESEMWLGWALLQAGRATEAEKHLRSVVKRKPELADGWSKLALALQHQGRLEETMACHEKVVTLRPDQPDGWVACGLTLALLGRPGEALQCHERALALDPASATAHLARAQALHQGHRIPEAIAAYDRAIALDPGGLTARSYRLFALHNLDQPTPGQLFAEHVDYGRALNACAAPALRNSPDPERPLRIAILSADLREHSCAYFIAPLLRQLDRRRFELFLYHDHFCEDAVSARLRESCATWRNFVGQPAAIVEEAIRADAPDVLIDLAGHTALNRLPLFARRLAPVQVTYLGYPDTTGVPAMDYRFTDDVADPVGVADRFATERLVRFAPVAWTYDPPAEAPAPGLSPGSSGGPVTFGCFNNPGKVTDSMLAVWGALLERAGEARLLLKGIGLEEPAVQTRYRERMRQAGIPGERVEFLGRTPGKAEHLALYGRVDVALDTFPYHGTTTTCEALWMGVPVVTRAGDRHASRVGASLLRAIGHPEWVAENEDGYVRIAVELANDRERLRKIRHGLRDELRQSPLLDHASQAKRFGAVLWACWREWCVRQSAAGQGTGANLQSKTIEPQMNPARLRTTE